MEKLFEVYLQEKIGGSYFVNLKLYAYGSRYQLIAHIVIGCHWIWHGNNDCQRHNYRFIDDWGSIQFILRLKFSTDVFHGLRFRETTCLFRE